MAVCAIMTLGICSCDNNDPNDFYGKHRQMQLVDNGYNIVEMTYATPAKGGGFNIIGGMGDNHRIEVMDEDILTATYNPRSSLQPENVTFLASVNLHPKKVGETSVIVTDTDTDETKMIKVKVIYNYATLTIRESTTEGLMNGMKICLMDEGEEGGNEYHIAIQDDNEYISYEKGKYHFDLPEHDRSYFFLTLKNDEKETTWKITDADNNSRGYDDYISDVIKGIRLHDHVLTKMTPSYAYPQIFLFTDTADSERHFLTGPAKTMWHLFE